MTTKIDADKYISDNNRLVEKLANKFYLNTSNFSRDDLVQEGNLAVVRALDGFDKEKQKEFNNKISTYVYRAVHRSMRDFVRKNKHDVKYSASQQLKDYENRDKEDGPWRPNPIAARLDVGVDAEGAPWKNTIPSGAPPVIDELVSKENVSILLEEINNLPDRERDIVTARYLDGTKLAELAETQQCSRQRIDFISKRAMKKLTSRVKARIGDLF